MNSAAAGQPLCHQIESIVTPSPPADRSTQRGGIQDKEGHLSRAHFSCSKKNKENLGNVIKTLQISNVATRMKWPSDARPAQEGAETSQESEAPNRQRHAKAYMHLRLKLVQQA